jgi:hypothetical protein
MQSNGFEQAYGDFIDRREYDEAQNALHSIVRISFTAGWNAAGGNPPTSQPGLELLPGRKKGDEPSDPHEL